MRKILVILALASPFAAHADKVVCFTEPRTNALIYDAASMTMDFPVLNGVTLSAPNPMRITGAIKDRTGASAQEIIFTYPMADGREVEIAWLSQEQEILRGLRSSPIWAQIKQSGVVVSRYPTCRWQ